MNYKTLSFNPRRNIYHFFIDTLEDLKYLPKETASTVLVGATGETYICTNDKQWIKFNINKGCSSSNNSDNNNSQNQSDVDINNIMTTLFNSNIMAEVNLSGIDKQNMFEYALTYNNTSSPYFIGYCADDSMIEIMAPINTMITLVYDSKTLENYTLCASYTGQDNGVEYKSIDYNFTSKITDYGTEISFKIPNTKYIEFASNTEHQR